MAAYTLVGEHTLVPNHPDEARYANVKGWEYLIESIRAVRLNVRGEMEACVVWVGYADRGGEWFPWLHIDRATRKDWLARATADNHGVSPFASGQNEVWATVDHIRWQEEELEELIADRSAIWRQIMNNSA